MSPPAIEMLYYAFLFLGWFVAGVAFDRFVLVRLVDRFNMTRRHVPPHGRWGRRRHDRR